MIVLADPIPPQVSQLQPPFYLCNKRPSPSFPVAFSFIGANRPRRFHRLDSLPLKHKSLPSLASQTLAQMSFFVIASLLSVGKDAIGQANIMSTQKMLRHLSQFPNGILRKVICCLPGGGGLTLQCLKLPISEEREVALIHCCNQILVRLSDTQLTNDEFQSNSWKCTSLNAEKSF